MLQYHLFDGYTPTTRAQPLLVEIKSSASLDSTCASLELPQPSFEVQVVFPTDFPKAYRLQLFLTFAGGGFSSRCIPLGIRKPRSNSAPGTFQPRGCRALSAYRPE